MEPRTTPHRHGDVSAGPVRRAANLSVIALACYVALFATSTQVASLRAASPWSEDPYDGVASYAAILTLVVAAVTWVRGVSHRQGQRLPAATGRQIVRGCSVVVAAVFASAVADWIAVVRRPTLISEPRVAALLVLLTLTTLLSVPAATLLLRAAVPRRRVHGLRPPDIFDDLLRLIVSLPVARRRPRPRMITLRVVCGVRRWLDRSRLSPRRHRVLACVCVAFKVGLTFAVWHAFREGPWATAWGAGLFAGLAAGASLLALLVSVFYLDLIRPIPLRD